MSRKFKVEKAHCELHNMDFRKLTQIRVSCQRYQKCLEEAIARHEANIAEAKQEAEEKGRQWAAVKAVLQIVCPYEEPPHCIPESFQVKTLTQENVNKTLMNEKVEKALTDILEKFYPNSLSIKILEIEVQNDSWIVKAGVSDSPSKRFGHEVIIVVKKYEIT